MISIDTTNICSHLQKKLFEEDGRLPSYLDGYAG